MFKKLGLKNFNKELETTKNDSDINSRTEKM